MSWSIPTSERRRERDDSIYRIESNRVAWSQTSHTRAESCALSTYLRKGHSPISPTRSLCAPPRREQQSSVFISLLELCAACSFTISVILNAPVRMSVQRRIERADSLRAARFAASGGAPRGECVEWQKRHGHCHSLPWSRGVAGGLRGRHICRRLQGRRKRGAAESVPA